MFYRQWTATVTRVLVTHQFPTTIGAIVADYSSLLTLDEMKIAVAADRAHKHGEVFHTTYNTPAHVDMSHTRTLSNNRCATIADTLHTDASTPPCTFCR